MKTGILRQPGKVTMLQICMLLFLGCFFLGVFLAIFSFRDEALWIGFFSENLIRQFQETGQNAEEWIKLFCWRGIPWLVIVVTQRFVFGWVLCAGWCGWLGASGGFVFCALLGRYGFSGIFQMGALGFPQMIFYAAAYLVLLALVDVTQKEKKARRNAKVLQRSYEKKRMILIGLFFFIDTAVYAVGVWMEYAISPWILQHL